MARDNVGATDSDPSPSPEGDAADHTGAGEGRAVAGVRNRTHAARGGHGARSSPTLPAFLGRGSRSARRAPGARSLLQGPQRGEGVKRTTRPATIGPS